MGRWKEKSEDRANTWHVHLSTASRLAGQRCSQAAVAAQNVIDDTTLAAVCIKGPNTRMRINILRRGNEFVSQCLHCPLP